MLIFIPFLFLYLAIGNKAIPKADSSQEIVQTCYCNVCPTNSCNTTGKCYTTINHTDGTLYGCVVREMVDIICTWRPLHYETSTRAVCCDDHRWCNRIHERYPLAPDPFAEDLSAKNDPNQVQTCYCNLCNSWSCNTTGMCYTAIDNYTSITLYGCVDPGMRNFICETRPLYYEASMRAKCCKDYRWCNAAFDEFPNNDMLHEILAPNRVGIDVRAEPNITIFSLYNKAAGSFHLTLKQINNDTLLASQYVANWTYSIKLPRYLIIKILVSPYLGPNRMSSYTKTFYYMVFKDSVPDWFEGNLTLSSSDLNYVICHTCQKLNYKYECKRCNVNVGKLFYHNIPLV